MEFLDELRAFLRNPTRDHTRRGSLERYHRHLLTALERRERAGASADDIERMFGNLGSRLDRYTIRLEDELATSGFSDDEIPALVEQAISRWVGLDPDVGSVTRKLALRKASSMASMQTAPYYPHNIATNPWRDVHAYLRELRLLDTRGERAVVTSLGRIFLELTGKDAVEWLLNVEAAQSIGRNDPWRIDRATLQQLVHQPSQSWDPDGPRPSLNWSSFRRLCALGLAHEWTDQEAWECAYTIADNALPILRDVADDSDSPMAVLVNALLQDDLTQRLPGRANSPISSQTSATTRQARLIVHEVRNALIPVKDALDELARQTRAAGLEAQTTALYTTAARGLQRVLSFADNLQDMIRLADQHDEIFEVSSAVREAVGIVDGEIPGSAHVTGLDMDDALPALRGNRVRLILALTNLLRNAHQHRGDTVARVNIRAFVHSGRLRIEIDDDGPGVSADARRRIYHDGYSTRPGGSGHGLPLARTVVENEMNGTLTCDDGSSLGGARFVITFPPHDGSAV